MITRTADPTGAFGAAQPQLNIAPADR